jgi:hypothetical protein
MYRLAKKYWFSDFGAYRGLNGNAEQKAGALQEQLAQRSTAELELQTR